MADAFTANYGWTKPDIGASDDTWGDKLNADLDAIDAQVRTIEDGVIGPQGPQGPPGPPGPQGPQGPGAAFPDAPNTSLRFGRYNSTWQPDAIQIDAPNDGGAYLRQSGAWTAGVTGGPYLPLAGGTMTGPLTMQGSNMIALNSPLASGQSAIIGQKATVNRWQMMIGDYTAEGLNNVGSNFSLVAFSTTGTTLGTWLAIARADGAVTFNGSGVTIQGGLAVNGTLALAGPGNLAMYGGTAGQVLATNGSGILSWATRLADAPSDGQFYTRQNAAWAVAPGGMTDAPNDGTAYARKSAAWAHLTHTDITDWTATLAPYALTTAVPVASTTPPLMDGGAAVGTATTYARADHVHPTDTHAMGDNRIINGDMRIDQRNNGAVIIPVINSYVLDRWFYYATQAGKVQTARNPGNPWSLAVASQSAYATLATDYFAIAQKIEADQISDFFFGAANAQPITLSFQAFSTQGGLFSGSIRNDQGTRSYPFTYTLPVSAWVNIHVTIPGDTAGTWVMTGNALGMIIGFDLGSGANFRGPAGAWASGNYVGVTGSVSVVGISGADFYVTGVKLEIGSVATPYNRQSLAKSMADCQRYYLTLSTTIRFTGSGAISGTNPLSWYQMRAAPTAALITAGTRSNITAPSILPYASNSGAVSANSIAAGDAYSFNDLFSLSAEL